MQQMPQLDPAKPFEAAKEAAREAAKEAAAAQEAARKKVSDDREARRARLSRKLGKVQSGRGKPAMRWRGLLEDQTRFRRGAVAILLLIASFTLTFTQLGFVHIGLGENHNVYLMMQMLPLAAACLLLGPLQGTLQGFLAGIVLRAHAFMMPLDFYEMAFVTDFTSVVMLTFMGLTMGLLFAIAFRNKPSWPKRIVRAGIICFILSFLYSTVFFFSVVLTVALDWVAQARAADLSSELTQQQVLGQVSVVVQRMGDAPQQAILDTLLMLLTCIGCFAVAEKLTQWRKGMHMRTKFNAWMGVVLSGAFMVTAAVNFMSITISEHRDALEDMQSTAWFVSSIEDAHQDQVDLVFKFVDVLRDDHADVTDEEWETLVNAVSASDALNGFQEERDGLVLWVVDGSVGMSNVTSFDLPDMSGLSADVKRAMQSSIDTGSVRRIVYDTSIFTPPEGQAASTDASVSTPDWSIEQFTKYGLNSELAYLFCDESEYGQVVVIKPAHLVYKDRWTVMGWSTLSILMLLVVVFGLTAVLLNRLVLQRIDETNGVLKRITDGNLDSRVQIRDTFEFESLAEGINTTVGALKGWIGEAETRMDAELETAKSIQENALPRIFPPFPEILKFDVYASMKPARQVGGDFYDFFQIGDCDANAGKLGFVVADVSGKGVPAALFMMEAKSQLRSYVTSGMELGEAVENVNRQLCDGNDAGMFVTAWVGVLDYATGHVDYVNAGHNPPLVWRYHADGQEGDEGNAQAAGGWEWLHKKSGLPLGLFDGAPYKAHSLDCLPGEQFLLYTDGVTEAMDTDENLYGEERLKELLEGCVMLHPRELVSEVRLDVARHASGAEQSDDITVLSLEVGVPPELTATLILPADIDMLPRVNDFIHNELDRRLCPVRAQNQLDIAVEELFVNVCHYAYPDLPEGEHGVARVSYTYSADPPSVTVDIADDGIPYNPLAKPDAVTPDDIMAVPIGGLGILMAKQSVDDMTYRREDGSNIVTIVKMW